MILRMFSDGEVTPRAPTIDSNVTSIEYDKDPINSTIGTNEILFLPLSLIVGKELETCETLLGKT